MSDSVQPHRRQPTRLPRLQWSIGYSEVHCVASMFLVIYSFFILLLFSHQIVPDSVTLWTVAHQASCPSLSPGVCPSSCPLNWWCHPTISSRHPLFLLPSIFPSIRVFSNELALLIRWPKYWLFNISISPSNEYSELISFRIDWFDLLAVQGTLKSLLQHHNWKASILWCPAFFMSNSHICTWLLEKP